MKKLRRIILANGFVFCAKRYCKYLHGLNNADSDYVDWLSLTDWFDKWYWYFLKKEVPE